MQNYTHNMGVFLAKDNTRIFYQYWTTPDPVGGVLISHGLGEHSGRYTNLLEELDGCGINFYALDHRGHGKSGGIRGHVDFFSNYTNDMKQYVDSVVKAENKQKPLIMLGHSMGGLIAMQYAFNYPADLDYLILSAAALIPSVKVPAYKVFLGKLLSRFFPRITLNNELDPRNLSTDQAVVKDYIDDPLVHDRVSAKWFTEYLNCSEDCLNRLPEITLPTLIIHGTEDRMSSGEGSKQIYEQISSKDKEIKFFEGLFHETMNEALPEREKVLNLLSDRILKNVQNQN